jgi:hypothetical protein
LSKNCAKLSLCSMPSTQQPAVPPGRAAAHSEFWLHQQLSALYEYEADINSLLDQLKADLGAYTAQHSPTVAYAINTFDAYEAQAVPLYERLRSLIGSGHSSAAPWF